MKTYILGALFGITSIILAPSTAIAVEPDKLNQQALKLSCDFKGSTAISRLFFDMADKFPEPTRKSVTVQMQGQLRDFTFETTDVYEIANLDGLIG